tara:strand:- start:308 stop:556 length:249 start_codon:yes stop_codon:yes gene_type:complete
MSNEEVFSKIQDIFRDVFDDKTLEIRNETNSSHIEDWDSLNNINLLVAIEKEFDIKFTINELQSLNDVGAMIELMMSKLNKK